MVNETVTGQRRGARRYPNTPELCGSLLQSRQPPHPTQLYTAAVSKFEPRTEPRGSEFESPGYSPARIEGFANEGITTPGEVAARCPEA